MTSRELENLVEVGQLKRAPVNDGEIAGLVRSGEARLKDAANMVGSPAPTWRLLTKCHGLRNQWEYEGTVDLDERLVTDLISAVEGVRDALRRQTPPPGE